ncbi:STN domain-containing protein, partial [Luteimonas aquatica]|uniref:STN domain-containing protein n=1 Tax=Luteimonas aquatica TaxID=450364 RepID=UPI001F58F283
MQVRDQRRQFKRAMRPCVLFLALLPCMTAYARNDVATAKFDIPQQRLDAALSEYARQSGKQLLYAPELAAGKTAHAVQGDKTPSQALDELLAGTGLNYATNASGAILISDRSPNGGAGLLEQKPAAGGTEGNAPEVAEAQPAVASQEAEAQQETAPAATASQAKSGDATTLGTITVTAQ